MRLPTLSLLVAGAFGIAACGGDSDDASSRETANVEQALARVQRSTGRSVDDVRCESVRSESAKAVRWSCETIYSAGDKQRCQTGDLKGGALRGIYCGEEGDGTYSDCLKRKSRGFCKAEAQRQFQACIDVPRDKRPCREAIYRNADQPPQ